mmetsp:Transcript_27116/g.90101  ORF Transcript_27116/g.90101 Transcript_27116/m.90101 type:complete len:201 (+) Transcript_27116:1366-1968(+)
MLYESCAFNHCIWNSCKPTKRSKKPCREPKAASCCSTPTREPSKPRQSVKSTTTLRRPSLQRSDSFKSDSDSESSGTPRGSCDCQGGATLWIRSSTRYSNCAEVAKKTKPGANRKTNTLSPCCNNSCSARTDRTALLRVSLAVELYCTQFMAASSPTMFTSASTKPAKTPMKKPPNFMTAATQTMLAVSALGSIRAGCTK